MLGLEMKNKCPQYFSNSTTKVMKTNWMHHVERIELSRPLWRQLMIKGKNLVRVNEK